MEYERAISTTLYLAGPKNTFIWCTKKGDLQRAFPMDVANGNHPTDVGLALGSTIHFGSLEFTAAHLGRLSLSPQEWDLGAIFIGMVHNWLPSPSTTL
jgi:hypothetical protein